MGVSGAGPATGNACGRTAQESWIQSPYVFGVGTILTLATGSAGSVIDGFKITGGDRTIESTSGPIDNVVIRNNFIYGFKSSGIFLNDNGIDVTIHQNWISGTNDIGTGDIVHLDTDNFDGFQLSNNCIENGIGTGFFVDGNHNVGVSGTPRSPQISGNTFSGNVTGANLGSRAFEYGTISGNTFTNNLGPGLQGGIQHSTISGNAFLNNGKSRPRRRKRGIPICAAPTT